MIFLWSRLGNEKGFISTSLHRVSFLISLPYTWTRPAASHRPYYSSGSLSWEFAQRLSIYTCNITFGNIQVTTIWKCVFCNVSSENRVLLWIWRAMATTSLSMCYGFIYIFMCFLTLNWFLCCCFLWNESWRTEDWISMGSIWEMCNKKQTDWFPRNLSKWDCTGDRPNFRIILHWFLTESMDTAYHEIPIVSILELRKHGLWITYSRRIFYVDMCIWRQYFSYSKCYTLTLLSYIKYYLKNLLIFEP